MNMDILVSMKVDIPKSRASVFKPVLPVSGARLDTSTLSYNQPVIQAPLFKHVCVPPTQNGRLLGAGVGSVLTGILHTPRIGSHRKVTPLCEGAGT